MPEQKASLRNRIKEHRLIRAGDLAPHPMNWRGHPEEQRDVLRALYEEVGFSRSLLAFELPDGRLQLIDGHLRRELTPDAFVTVEVLDVDEEEARKLLLSMDPVAGLATADGATLDRLREVTEADHEVLAGMWERLAEADKDAGAAFDAAREEAELAEQFLILVTCSSEEQQRELLGRLGEDGVECRPLTSFGS